MLGYAQIKTEIVAAFKCRIANSAVHTLVFQLKLFVTPNKLNKFCSLVQGDEEKSISKRLKFRRAFKKILKTESLLVVESAFL